MAHRLYRLGRFAFDHKWSFVAAWVLALFVTGIIAATMSKPMQDSLTIPNTPAEQARAMSTELFAGELAEAAADVTMVLGAPAGSTLLDSEVSSAVQRVVTDLQALPQLGSSATIVDPATAAGVQTDLLVGSALEQGVPEDRARADAAALSPLSADGTVGTIEWAFDVAAAADVLESTKEQVSAIAETAREDGLEVGYLGAGVEDAGIIDPASELIGLAVAAVILVFTFGSLVAAGLPLLTAVVGVAIGVLGVVAATAFADLGSTTPLLATMLGLAVGIDYALFVLSRYRHELDRSADRREATARAVGTAGSSIVFAGATVVIALAALAVVGIPFLTSMGLAAAGTVAVAVLIALTLLPALIGVFGRKTFAGRIPGVAPTTESATGDTTLGRRWVGVVRRAPVRMLVAAVVALVLLALPVTHLAMALPSDATAAEGTPQRIAAELIDRGFGEGRNAPLLMVIDGKEATVPDAFASVVEWAAEVPGVEGAQVIALNDTADGARVLITPSGGPNDDSTKTLLADLRGGTTAVEAATGTTIGVTGIVAVQTDVTERLMTALPVYLLIVVGLAFLLLTVVFGSIIVPLTAAAGFLLSVGATFGVTVLLFQDGVLGMFSAAPLASSMPIFLIGIVFGLAMDYHVFLVSRMKESYSRGADATTAVVDGFTHGARVVTAAALIMVSVFAAFVAQDDLFIQSMGFALATAVFLDAFVVRMTIIPAAMFLLGRRAWWMPAQLRKVLPTIDIDGESLTDDASGPAGSVLSADTADSTDKVQA
ncbi:MMPL family transporter [Rhodococcus sp. 1168]|uniref:MMPL family transporter n=1 Tax=Rhodococcus sp. 1168 TaxID=2018041 RepID=UPI000A0ACF13|nr:MMPL family transporter [Rhodococcus sp. 1168]ORI13509.1 hypothetical protein BJI47_23045 [Rhodococcus sp. 1168]